MKILLTNDDGVYAPGLAAMERALSRLGEICLVAPLVEQSGAAHSITYLSPLICQEVFDGDRHRGWAVEGSPADCVKIGIFEFCGSRPDLVVSGINGGLNAGINVLYSGTVAAAIEGAFFGIPSVAVSLEYAEHPEFDRAAALACRIIEQILEKKGAGPQLFNLNIPTAAVADGRREPPPVRVVPMDVARWGERFEKRIDPRGRSYFWATGGPPAPGGSEETDLAALMVGHVTLTPLDFQMTSFDDLDRMRNWDLTVEDSRRLKP